MTQKIIRIQANAESLITPCVNAAVEGPVTHIINNNYKATLSNCISHKCQIRTYQTSSNPSKVIKKRQIFETEPDIVKLQHARIQSISFGWKTPRNSILKYVEDSFYDTDETSDYKVKQGKAPFKDADSKKYIRLSAANINGF